MLSPATLAGIANVASPVGQAARVQPVRVQPVQPPAPTAVPPATNAPQATAPAPSAAPAPTRTMPRGSLLDITV
jgi:hypothetical protein